MTETARTAACTSQPGGPNPPRLWSRAMTTCITSVPTNALNMRRKAEILKYKANSAQLTKKQKWAQMVHGGGPLAKKVWANQNDLGSNPNIENLPLVGNTLLTCTYPIDWVLEQVYYGGGRYGTSVCLNGSGTILAVGDPSLNIVYNTLKQQV